MFQKKHLQVKPSWTTNFHISRTKLEAKIIEFIRLKRLVKEGDRVARLREMAWMFPAWRFVKLN